MNATSEMFTNTANVKISNFRGFGIPFYEPSIGDLITGYAMVHLYEDGIYYGAVGEEVHGKIVSIGSYWSENHGHSGRWVTLEWESPKKFTGRCDL